MLSVVAGTNVTVISVDGPIGVPVEKLAGDTHAVYDCHGYAHTIAVKKAEQEETLYSIKSAHGLPQYVGEHHTILCRKDDTARWGRINVCELDKPVYVMHVQRKIVFDEELVNFMDYSEKDGVHFLAEKGSQIDSIMRTAAFSGVTTTKRKADLIIDVERGRPKCFATKLLAGSFETALETTLGGLVMGGIVLPTWTFDDDYLEAVQRTKVLMEGTTIFNQTPIYVNEKLEKKADVYHIFPSNPTIPVELTWFHN